MDKRKTLIAIGVLLVAAATLSIAAFAHSQTCCMGKKQKGEKQEPPIQATQQGNAQATTVEITSKRF